MKDPIILIEHYRATAQAGEQMLEAAQRSAWPEVARIALAISTITEQLREVDAVQAMDASQLDERMNILTRLVHVDAEIRHLREPWLAKLDRILAPSRRKHASAAQAV